MGQITGPRKKRMVIVSNRLPFTVREEAGDLKFISSVGGLATGLSSYLEFMRDYSFEFQDCLWVGWPGSTIGEEKTEEIRARSLAEFNAVPVFLSEEEIENFYQGFCNKTIWPLFHYFQVYTNYDDNHWTHYVEVNRSFCRTLLDLIEPDDTLWIHDYHLMLLPAMIREQSPSTNIGFFLHIPFPNFEIFRLLPSKWRREILKGLLGADLIGFHTNDYRQDFLRCVIRILGYDANMGEMIVGDRIVKAETFPMGIDYRKYHDGASDPAIQQERDELHKRLGKAKVILSIDRLDYTKGIVNRLEAFEIFLESYPSWHNKVVLILIVVPSRVDVEHYEMMKNQIEALVGKINGRFGSPDWTPIIYMFRTLTFSPLVAMYASSDVALITPLRDGMNLIAKEYIASRADKTGVLILSEMTGSSKELLEAVIINPNSRNEIAEALFEALNMPEEEQIRRNAIMQQRLQRYDVIRWATDFMEELDNAKTASQKYLAKLLGPNARNRLIEHYHSSNRRLLLLDYDGTIVPFATVPQNAVPSQTLLGILHNLSEAPGNEVVIISGRERIFLERWFSDIKINLVAEHGAWIKERNQDWLSTAKSANEWKPKLKPLLERYVDRVAGSFIEEKDFALVWHYRGAEPEPGKLAAQELKDHLLALTANWVHRQGLKTTLNMHPASGVQPHEDQYLEMARAMGIDPATDRYVQFDIANKKFAENYFKILHHPLEQQGIDFFWLDWQQEQTTKIPGVNPTWWLNYTHFTDMERRGKRPLLFHRWGGLGNHRYQIGFSGDTVAVWDSLAFQPHFTATAANVGYGYWSHDIGGHMRTALGAKPAAGLTQDPDYPELYARWIQWGVFSPILRTHTTKDPESERRIWAYPVQYAATMREAYLLRYSLIPYIYTAARKAYDSGISICHPLYYEYPEAAEAYEFKDEYLFGSDMLVAPVTAPASRETDLATKTIWLPPGVWIEWFSGTELKGPAKIQRTFRLEEIPVYIKAGAIVPMQPKMRNIGEKAVDCGSQILALGQIGLSAACAPAAK